MPTSSLIDFDADVWTIGARTDAAGEAVDDLLATEPRLINSILTPGMVSEDAFALAPDSGMNLTLGSGSALSDIYAVQGSNPGQGVYLVRMQLSGITVAVPASDAQQRFDQVWLIVQDDDYDTSGFALPRIGYRRGDAGSGLVPGPDAEWDAAVLLWQVTVPGSATEIVEGNLVDERAPANLSEPLRSNLLEPMLPKAGGTMTGPLVLSESQLQLLRSTGNYDLRMFLGSGGARLQLDQASVQQVALALLDTDSVRIEGVNIQLRDASGGRRFNVTSQSGGIRVNHTNSSDTERAAIVLTDSGEVRFVGANVTHDQVPMGRVASGAYPGNGASNRLIVAGFAPKHVVIMSVADRYEIILTSTSSGVWQYRSGVSAQNSGTYSGGAATGFRVGSSILDTVHNANANGSFYTWFALG